MYKIPLTNSPNQTFKVTIPVNGENMQFKFKLWYNYQAGYWLFTAINLKTNSEIFSNLPLLTSKGKFANIISQLDYMGIGICVMVPVADPRGSMANDLDIGKGYVMVWGDNDV